MKFNEMLKKCNETIYIDKSINYKKLHKMIKSGIDSDSEAKFVEFLRNELVKFTTFSNEKHLELISSKEELNYSNDHECESLISTLYDYSQYLKANIIGSKKIFSSYEKKTGFTIPKELAKMIKLKSSESKNIKSIIKSINSERNDSIDGIDQVNDCKYWIPSENIVDLKLTILKYLSETKYIANAEKIDDSYVTSIYLDNSDFELYKAHVIENNKLFYIRLKWFGSNSSKIICELIESKSTQKFTIPENKVLNFLNGSDILDDIKDLNEEDAGEIYTRIQQLIINMRLKPVLRTFYKRCTFENKSKTITINLDSHLVMIKESSNMNVYNLPLRSWRRTDFSEDWPFRDLPPSEIIRLPFSLLEISSAQKIDWLHETLSNSNIKKVDDFEKFLHGTAILHPETEIMPSWLCQLEYKLNDKFVVERKSPNDERFIAISGESEISYDNSSVTIGDRNVVVPVRVEPKAFFANERTFLSWVQFAIFLGGIGTAMVGLGNSHAYICGIMFIVVAGIFAAYSLYLFHIRAGKIRTKDPGPYETVIGPAVIVGIFVMVMILSFIFKFPIKKNGLK